MSDRWDSVKMITGDHAITAQAIARRMGINKNGSVLAFTGAELAQMDNQELANVVQGCRRIRPCCTGTELRLVEALQSKGRDSRDDRDGVNDALPSNKQIWHHGGATGTEVTRQRDMLLTDDNLPR